MSRPRKHYVEYLSLRQCFTFLKQFTCQLIEKYILLNIFFGSDHSLRFTSSRVMMFISSNLRIFVSVPDRTGGGSSFPIDQKADYNVMSPGGPS